jgi:hypothetical protein
MFLIVVNKVNVKYNQHFEHCVLDETFVRIAKLSAGLCDEDDKVQCKVLLFVR